MFRIEGFEIKWVRPKIPAIVFAVIALILVTPFLLPSSVYKNIIESRLEKASGLDFNFEKGFSLSLLPSIKIDASDVLITGQLGQNVDLVGTVEQITVDMKLSSLLGGNIHIDNFSLVAPKFTINGDFRAYLPNWIRMNLSAARKEEIRYLEILQHFIEDSIFESAKITDGTILWKKDQNSTIDIQNIEIDVVKPEAGKDFTVNSNAYVNNRSVDFKLRLERPDEFLRGFRSKLNFKLDSTPLEIEFAGSAAKRQTFVSQGDIRIDVPSIPEFCLWLSSPELCEGKEGNVLFVANLNLRDQRLQIENASYTQDPLAMHGSGIIDFKESKPEVIGTITLPARTLPIYRPFLIALKKIDFRNFFFDAFNANVDLVSLGVTLASGDVLKPKFKFLVRDGRLTFTTDQFDAFGSLTNFRLRWHHGLENGYLDARVETNGFDLERFQKSTGLRLNMKGTAKTTIEVQAEGAILPELLETAHIHGDFVIMDGVIQDPKIASSLTGQEVKSFEFAEIKGRVQGNKGQITSENIKFIAPFVDVSGIARWDFISNELNINLSSNIPAQQNGQNDAQALPQSGFVQIAGPIGELVLSTSSDQGNVNARAQTSHSGLLPLVNETPESSSDNQEIVIEETDLLE